MDAVHRGRVKVFHVEEGWGVITSTTVPGDVWVHYSQIEGTGYKALHEGDLVEFRYEPAKQDSWRYRAMWVRRIEP